MTTPDPMQRNVDIRLKAPFSAVGLTDVAIGDLPHVLGAFATERGDAILDAPELLELRVDGGPWMPFGMGLWSGVPGGESA